MSLCTALAGPRGEMPASTMYAQIFMIADILLQICFDEFHSRGFGCALEKV